MASEGESASDAMRQAAAEWFVLGERGLTESQRREFEHWLGRDPRHAELLTEFDRTWECLGRADPSPPAEARRRLAPIVWLPLAAAAAAAALLTLRFAWLGTGRSAPAGPALFAEASATEVGETRRLELPDGSVLQLNTDSAVEVRLTAGERDVKVSRGEVHFQVAHNAARPFLVHAEGVDVRDIGTAFDVRLRPDSVDILVTDGRVEVSGGGWTRSVTAGERAVAARGHQIPVSVAEIDAAAASQALAWRGHQLQFDSEPLAVIVAEFNRYNRHKLVVNDPRLALRRFGGTFPAADYTSLLGVLERQYGVLAEERGDSTVLRLPR